MAIESTSTTSTSTGQVGRVKNSVNAMMTPSIGPDMARVKVTSLRYILFDYGGSIAPVVVAKALCTPTDGSNDNRDFEIQWTIGAKTGEFIVMDDGKWLRPAGSRVALTNSSNFAWFQKSLKDAGYDPDQFDEEAGLSVFDGAEITVRRVPAQRSGFQSNRHSQTPNQDQKPGDTQREDTYYTCLKIDSLPGESKKAGGTKKTTTATKPAASAAKSNGNGSGSSDIVDVIAKIVSDAGGSTSLKDFKMSLFRHFKDEGKAVADCQKLATEYGTEDFLVTTIMEKGLSNWAFEGDTLAIS